MLARCETLRARTRGCFDVRARGAIDPSAFVKGWAVEAVAAMLVEEGARNLCVHAGGDVRVRGERAPGPAVARRDPAPVQRDRMAAVLCARDLAVATSGAYERGAHIVDPRTGRPPRACSRSPSSAPTSAPPTPMPPRPSRWASKGPAWTAGLGDYEALTILSDGRVLSTRGVPDVE